MTPREIEEAVEALRDIKRAQEVVEVLDNRRVIQITLDGDVELGEHSRGTGWAGRIGFPDDLAKIITAALHKWAHDKLAAARKEALLCGVTLEDEPRPTQPNNEVCIDMSQLVTIDYTNWKGTRRKRNVRPVNLVFMSTEHHNEKQWLMEAVDLDDAESQVTDTATDKVGTKMFALLGIHSWEPFMGPRK